MKLSAPKIPFLSNLTGTWISAAEATDPDYWVRHIHSTVRLADNLQTVLSDAPRLLLEVGPGTTLSTLARQQLPANSAHMVISSLPHPQDGRSDLACMLSALGRVWACGQKVDWEGVNSGTSRRRIPLPTYAFDRQRYWVDPPHLEYREQEACQDGTILLPAHNPVDRPSPENGNGDYKQDLPESECEKLVAQVWQDASGIAPLAFIPTF
ncbi:hypothetical protein EPA93_15880 [Ktedonosporobacter rubrisoli]|uniref:Polyketide synthase n=1 Tax=Ktedonosporobacter rubrisoli TaxID=2509675 RepID=A0A4P6JQH5_KTERU|nr:hypothetical protein [Ktedonosporobacter rubrisoli]QBD77392.1 hypothetical protein EPA93_15880 [Ktedonosporobacter rubrisoli]